MSYMTTIFFSTFSGNLAGNMFVNTYILNGAAVFSVLGVWFIKLGRRNAIASAYLIAAGVSAIVVTMQVCGKNLQRS